MSGTPVVSRRTKNIESVLTPPILRNTEPSGSDSSSSGETIKYHFKQKWQLWQRRIPCLKRVQESFLRIPPRLRMGFIFFWFCWKIAVAVLFLVMFFRPKDDGAISVARAVGDMAAQRPTRVLYVVTTLAEYNSGTRATSKGQDRLAEVLLPVLVDSVESMIAPPFHYEVDVFLICAYELKPEREQLLRDRLPQGVGFQVWDDAAPLGYDNRSSKDKVIPNTRALARQHRYVVKDKFEHYDMFLAFEDDMRITGHHIQNHLELSEEIEQMRRVAPTSLADVPENHDDYKKTKFHGGMTKQQLSRVVPGFIRVEVLLNETIYGAQQDVLPIPQDYDFGEGYGKRHIEPEICCHVHMEPNVGTPTTPSASDLIMWETNVKAFSLRQMPRTDDTTSLTDWVVLMLGPGKRLDLSEKIGGYWSGRDGGFGDQEKKPSGGPPDLVAQQGGWMATREQIHRMNSGLCMGSFLPPFDKPTYNADGQESMNVEFWSGSYQFFSGVRGGCNMQRVISLHPDHFSNHLLYHVANNKQRQLRRDRMVRADHLFGQLNHVRKNAEKARRAERADKGSAR